LFYKKSKSERTFIKNLYQVALIQPRMKFYILIVIFVLLAMSGVADSSGFTTTSKTMRKASKSVRK
jgi:hypothetical protein